MCTVWYDALTRLSWALYFRCFIPTLMCSTWHSCCWRREIMGELSMWGNLYRLTHPQAFDLRFVSWGCHLKKLTWCWPCKLNKFSVDSLSQAVMNRYLCSVLCTITLVCGVCGCCLFAAYSLSSQELPLQNLLMSQRLSYRAKNDGQIKSFSYIICCWAFFLIISFHC